MTRVFFFVSMILAAALCFPAGTVEASTARAVRKHVEYSMPLTGKINVEPDGSVSAVVLDQEELPDALSDFVRSSAARWRFEPVKNEEGEAIAVRAPMRLRLVARTVEGGDFEVAIRSTDFSSSYDPNDETTVRCREQQPPRYPQNAARAMVGADTYVAVKVGRDGRVEDVATRQVNLHAIASERSMKNWRKKFAISSEKTIRDWTFRVPTEGPIADKPYWVVTVPVSYRIKVDPAQTATGKLGKWEAYVPGPVQPISWMDSKDPSRTSTPDALAEGGVYMPRADGLRLLTPLGED